VATGLGEPAPPATEPNASARPAASAPPRRPAGSSLPAGPPRPVTAPSTASLEADRRRTIALVALPAGVLGAVVALGIAVYLGAAQRSPRHEAPGQAAPSGGADSVMPQTTSPGELISGDTARHAKRSPTDTGSRVASQAAAPTAARDSNVSPADTAAPNRARRARRSRPPEAVPGWLPQGQATFTPKDSSGLRQPDSSARARPDAPLDT